MPLEKIAEYRIALPARQAFDVIAKLGELGYVMLPPRPPEIPAPHIPPDVADAVRKCDEIAKEISKAVQAYNIPPPEAPITVRFSTFGDMVKYVTEEGSEIVTRISQYMATITEVTSELTTLRRYLEVMERLGAAVLPEFRHLRVDLVLLEPGEVADFRKALELHNVQVMVFEGEKPLAMVIYPAWLKETVEGVYRVFNKTPIQLPKEAATPEAVKSRVAELERKLDSLNQELQRYLMSIRDRLYTVLEVSNAITQIVRQYTDTVIPEGEEVRTRLSELRKNIEATKQRLAENEVLQIALETLYKRKIEKFEVAALRVKLVAVKGALNTEVLAKVPHVVETAEKDVKIIMLFEVPPEFDVKAVARDGIVVEIPAEYLRDISSALSLVKKEYDELKSRLRELEEELNTFIKTFNKVSVYGVENLDKAGPDTVTIIAQLRVKDVKDFERALADILTKLAVHAEVRKYSKYAYVPEVPKERAPTLETYPRFIDVLKKIVYWYGIPKYGEVSPVPIAWWFFPVFYGWMFPDVGHGILIFLLGLLLAGWRYKGSNRVLKAIFDGKFAEWGIIFMQCGIWSVIFAFIEGGDIFGIPLNMIGIPSLYHLIHPIAEEAHAMTLQELAQEIAKVGAFEMVQHTIYLTLGWSMIVGIFILAASVFLKAVNYIRLGYKYDALAYYIPFGIEVLAWAFMLSTLGLVPLRPLALKILELKHAHELHIFTVLDQAYIGFVQLVTGPLTTGLFSPRSYIYAWLTVLLAVFAYLVARLFIDWRRHAHLHEPLGVYVVETAEIYIAWAFANVISFMRLGIIAIVHAILTALVVWGSFAIGVLSIQSWITGIAFLIALGAGGFIGFLVFRVFGKKFAAAFFAFCLLGAISGLLGGLIHSMNIEMIAIFVAALLGNICVVIFEGLVAFIQSLRLHFYEMFTKFFIGGGILFQPFKIGSPIVRIQIV